MCVCACEEAAEEEEVANEARGEDFSPSLEGSCPSAPAAVAAVLSMAPKKVRISSLLGSSAILVESSFR